MTVESYDFERLLARAGPLVERVHALGHDDAVIVVLEALLAVRRETQNETLAAVEKDVAMVAAMVARVERLERALTVSGMGRS